MENNSTVKEIAEVYIGRDFVDRTSKDKMMSAFCLCLPSGERRFMFQPDDNHSEDCKIDYLENCRSAGEHFGNLLVSQGTTKYNLTNGRYFPLVIDGLGNQTVKCEEMPEEGVEIFVINLEPKLRESP